MLFCNTLAVSKLRLLSGYQFYVEDKCLVEIFVKKCYNFQSYGYNISQLYVTLQEIREHYTDVLMQKCVHAFREIFDEDTYHPLQVIWEHARLFYLEF